MNQRFVQTKQCFDFILDMPSSELLVALVALRLLEEILHHPGMYKNLVNLGKNYQPQLVQEASYINSIPS